MGNDAPFLLLLPAAGAYWLLTRSWQFCYRLRHERPGLIAYQVVLFGTILLALGLLTNKLFAAISTSPYAVFIDALADVIAPAIKPGNASFAIVCLYSLGFGIIAPSALNKAAQWRGRSRDIYYLRANRDDAFEAQWYAAHQPTNFRLVQLTLDTNKVYIGTIAECPATEAGHRRSIELLPLASGYRDPETQTLTLTTDYVEASRQIESDASAASRFEVVIRADRIVSSSPFDFVLYARFWQEHSATSSTDVHPPPS
ncbi:hypothetical protein SSPSH_003515 [Salinisphaera shabanensis E1L3A]|jgi:hypothetical protein|uniref:Uncharacterized protein n=1 Tax=Salinisphaera shabanensis E1L3A TaxID=1033802 RepID=U2FN91_9GAMM|nr:hypothetical protein [Salinisphaera shabanensis]ERJ17669.1 hypothetical protein SSPSH_003515 [Salinisphaera shabanensis E1L3A]